MSENKAIIITDITCQLVDNSEEIEMPSVLSLNLGHYLDEPAVTKERLKPTEFVNVKGQRVFIATTKAVADIIGLPFEVFGKMEKSLHVSRNMLKVRTEEKLMYKNRWNTVLVENNKKDVDIKTASFRKRLKYLFTCELDIS